MCNQGVRHGRYSLSGSPERFQARIGEPLDILHGEVPVNRLTSAGVRPFRFTIISAVQFIILTLVGMLFYAGGTHSDPTVSGYSFFRNFFSSLGLLTAPNGQPNTVSAILFFIALSLAGLGLVVYFVFVLQFTQGRLATRVLSAAGSLFGVFAGVCFIGVAFTPADLLPEAHGWFVINAFRTFLLAVIPYAMAILLISDYPKRYALVYGIFAVLLLAYILLLIYGPGFGSSNGEVIQATGQKVIVYAAIITMLIQSIGAIGVLQKRAALNTA